MRIHSTFIFLLALANIASADNIVPDDAAIYRTALSVIVNHEKPEHFAVWNRTIGAAVILMPRVPRHAPESQFVTSLPGLPAVLQKQLFSEASAGLQIAPSMDRDGLLRAEAGLTAVGFSKIANNGQHDALLYAEVCLAGTDGVCGGEGFWFVKIAGRWQLKKHAYLWQGTTQPFWNMGTR